MTTTTAPAGTERLEPRPAFPKATGLPKPGTVRFVTAPDRLCLAIDGETEPGGAAFQAAVAALFSTAYPLHFLLRARGIETPVGHLEGMFERRDGRPSWAVEPEAHAPDAWLWTLFIAIPDEARDEDVAEAIELARGKVPPGDLHHLRAIAVREGPVAEALHVGPYDTEPQTIERMREALEAAGLAARGPHHEIYLNDPKRVGPDRTRTILRLPVRRAAGDPSPTDPGRPRTVQRQASH